MVAGKQGRQSAQQQGQGNKGADKGHERQHDDRPVLVQLVVVHIFSSLLFLLLFLLLLGGRIEYSPLDVVGGDEEPVLREGDRAVHGDVGDRPGRRVNDVDALDVLGLGSRSLWFRFLHFGFRFLCCFHWLCFFFCCFFFFFFFFFLKKKKKKKKKKKETKLIRVESRWNARFLRWWPSWPWRG